MGSARSWPCRPSLSPSSSSPEPLPGLPRAPRVAVGTPGEHRPDAAERGCPAAFPQVISRGTALQPAEPPRSRCSTWLSCRSFSPGRRMVPDPRAGGHRDRRRDVMVRARGPHHRGGAPIPHHTRQPHHQRRRRHHPDRPGRPDRHHRVAALAAALAVQAVMVRGSSLAAATRRR